MKRCTYANRYKRLPEERCGINLSQNEQLTTEFMKMGEEVKNIVKRSLNALVKKDAQEALDIISYDDIIDNQLIVVEDKATQILADRNPTGQELRRCLSMLKIAISLERIADLATNIAERTLEMKNEEFIKPLIHIPKLAELAVNMLDVSLKAYVENNPDLAEAVCKKDEEADNLYDELYQELMGIMTKAEELSFTRQAILLLLIGGYFERIADYATNIGEEAILINTGKRVKF